MKIEEYKSGYFREKDGIKVFMPNKIDYNIGWEDTKIDKLLADANKEIGELNAYSELVPNIDIYIKMSVTIEANKSNRIEGNKTTIEEDLMDIKDIDPEKRDDWEEVQNYVKAINYGTKRINEGFPFCSRLIKEIHKILMSKVKGEHKNPGEFRVSQNWIGGNMPSDAKFVPPPYEGIGNLLGDLENFINNKKIDTPHLIKAAIIHYQFETIHPFLDGNGRMGRLLVPLYLQSVGMLKKPSLYISKYIENNKDKYYDLLTKVREENEIIPWIKFFLTGIIEVSKDAKMKFKKAINFRKEMDIKIKNMPAKEENLRKILDILYNKPSITRTELRELSGVKEGTIKNIINILVKERVLVEKTGYTRNQVFMFKPYVELFN